MNIHPLDVALQASINGHPDVSENILRSYPDQQDARVLFNLGWHEMRHGNLRKGMQIMDAGRYINCFGSERIPGEIWRDQDLTNKTLLFRLEGGIGDQLIHFRFAKDFEAKGARVIISCSKELTAFISRHGYICVSNEHVVGVYYDYWVPAMSAAHVLGYEQNDISGAPYLNAPPRKLHSKANTLKVGIRWAGNPQFEHEQHRKFDPQLLIDLHKLHGVTLYSLQRDENLVDGLPFADLRDQIKTWDDTASILAGLDLVITSCTSVAHCAAALGVETWVIVPVLPYYIWAVPGDKSVWYESVRLFRQKEYGKWDQTLQEVEEALKDRLAVQAAA
jgi:hypothetical protein